MDVSMAEVVAEDVLEDVYKVEEYTSKEVMDGAVAHIKIQFTSHMSPVILKIHSGSHSQTLQVKGSLRTRYAQSSWKIKRCATPALEVLESTTRTSLSIR